MSESPRQVAVRIVSTLQEAGHVAYLAGGCVRDELLGLAPKDYDVATDASPERVEGLFRRTRGVGKAFGVMLVHLSGVTVEVTTFRREHGYTDRRRPDTVTFCDAESDAHRRDFTINALFIDPLKAPAVVNGVKIEGEVIDFVAGLSDMQRKLIRAVGDPERRLHEDNLRALRAVRFAARLGFAIDGETAGAIRKHASELAGVSRERIGDELRRMMADGGRVRAMELMVELGLDGPALEEAAIGTAGMNHPVLRQVGKVTSFGECLAAWAMDRFPGELPRELAARIGSRWRHALCLSNEERSELVAILEGVSLIEEEWMRLGVAARKRAAAAAWFESVQRLMAGRSPSLVRELERDVAVLAGTASGIGPEPLINGDDLIEAGMEPGPMFGTWLDLVYDAQLEDRVSTRAEALRLALELAGGEIR